MLDSNSNTLPSFSLTPFFTMTMAALIIPLRSPPLAWAASRAAIRRYFKAPGVASKARTIADTTLALATRLPWAMQKRRVTRYALRAVRSIRLPIRKSFTKTRQLVIKVVWLQPLSLSRPGKSLALPKERCSNSNHRLGLGNRFGDCRF